MFDFYEYVPFAPAVNAGNQAFLMNTGDMPLTDLWWLDFLVKRIKKPGMVAYEIGAWTGMSTCCIGEIVKECNGTLTTVDNFKGSNDNQAKMLNKVNVKGILERNLTRFELDDTVTIIEKSSNDCDVPDKSIDFLFIDGDHRYTQLKKDLDTWLPRMKDDGIMSGHDYDCNMWNDKFIEMDAEHMKDGKYIHHGVVKAVSEKFGTIKLFSFNGKPQSTIWVHERKNFDKRRWE